MALRNAAIITSSVKNGEEIFRQEISHHPPPRVTESRSVARQRNTRPSACSEICHATSLLHATLAGGQSSHGNVSL